MMMVLLCAAAFIAFESNVFNKFVGVGNCLQNAFKVDHPNRERGTLLDSFFPGSDIAVCGGRDDQDFGLRTVKKTLSLISVLEIYGEKHFISRAKWATEQFV